MKRFFASLFLAGFMLMAFAPLVDAYNVKFLTPRERERLSELQAKVRSDAGLKFGEKLEYDALIKSAEQREQRFNEEVEKRRETDEPQPVNGTVQPAPAPTPTPAPAPVPDPTVSAPSEEPAASTSAEKEEEKPKSNWKAMIKKHAFDIGRIVVPVLVAVLGFMLTRKKKRKFTKYLKMADKIYVEYKMKTKRLEAEMFRLKDILVEDLKKGKLDEAAYSIVEKRIEEYLAEAKEMAINERFGGMPEHLKATLHEMLEDGELSEEEFKKMQGIVAQTTGMSDKDKKSLKKALKDLQGKEEKDD